jgi:hypothetical protein
MDSRERVKLALNHRKADRIPIHDSVWGATVDRWRAEGLPSGVSPKDYFGFEVWGFGADNSPQLPIEVLSEDSEHIVVRDRFGGIRKGHRDGSTTRLIDCSCKTREDWEKLKPRLKPSDYRVDWVSGLQGFYRDHSRGLFITYGAAVGYDQILYYIALPRVLKAVISEP